MQAHVSVDQKTVTVKGNGVFFHAIEYSNKGIVIVFFNENEKEVARLRAEPQPGGLLNLVIVGKGG